MAERKARKQHILGLVGALLIGAAVLLFTTTLVMNNLKASAFTHSGGLTSSERSDWNSTNTSIDQLKTFMGICVILLGIMGIVVIGFVIVSAIGGGFGAEEGDEEE